MALHESQASKEKKTAVMNVIAVMVADGSVTPEEREHLARVCARVGITQRELAELFANPAKVQFTPPKDKGERIGQLLDIVFMMLADGKIDKREMEMCIAFAIRLGFSPSTIPRMVADIVTRAKKAKKQPSTEIEIEAFLGN